MRRRIAFQLRRFPCCIRRTLRPYRRGLRRRRRASGCSSGVEHNLAKVGVGRSNRLTRSSLSYIEKPRFAAAFVFFGRSKSRWLKVAQAFGLRTGHRFSNFRGLEITGVAAVNGYAAGRARCAGGLQRQPSLVSSRARSHPSGSLTRQSERRVHDRSIRLARRQGACAPALPDAPMRQGEPRRRP